MTANDPATITDAIDSRKHERQNAYLKLRCAQLQDDVVNLSSQVTRLQQELERYRGRADALAGSRP
ncbi:MAG TPA: hypothetical protein VMT68_05365 [Caulobacteraceae bacterium]|nr:hypothetical protein [Caulobacteraceae bacterium]